MKRRFLAAIAFMLTLAMLPGSALSALADAPEALDEIIEEIATVQDGEGEAADEVELIPGDEDVLMLEGDAPLIDDLTGDDLTLDGLADLELSDTELSEELLVADTEGATDEAALGLAAGEAWSNSIETSAEGTVEAVTASGGMDNDALFEAWIKQRLPGLAPRRTFASAYSGRASLDGINLKLYDALVPMIKAVANGEKDEKGNPITSTKFAIDSDSIGLKGSWWTAEQLGLANLTPSSDEEKSAFLKALVLAEGVYTDKILSALLVDYPYELYWFDKVKGGLGWSISISMTTDKTQCKLSKITSGNMGVAKAYSKEGKIGTYEVNPVLPERVTAAVANIKRIIANNKDNGDLAKLKAYANEICRLVQYNHDAANDDTTPYGDPWQLVYIFDGDETDDTNVVCEGYSKGFKYLCDLSEFDGEVYCELMSGSIPGGAHMWNALRMPDGRTYLVDLTNSDGGSTCNEKYFLKGFSGEPGGPFTSNETGQKFTLRQDMATLFSAAWLTMSNADFGKGYTVTASAEHGTMTAEPAIADAGQTVTLTVNPDAGYGAVAPTVRYGKQSLTVQHAGDNRWTFTMPYGNVSAATVCESTDFSVQGYSGEYDGQPHGIRVTLSVAGTVTYGTEKGIYSSEAPTWKDAGSHTVYYRIAFDGAEAVEGEAAVVITAKEVALGWGNTSFTYDGNAHAPSATVSGLVPGDSCTVTVEGGQKNAGSWTATASALSNGNYTLPKANTHDYTIGKRSVTVSGLSATDKVYDGDTSAKLVYSGARFTGIVSGDSLTITAAGAFADKNIGTGKIVTISNLTLGGSSVGNYTLASAGNQTSVKASITAKPVTVRGLLAADKVYDGTSNAKVTGTAMLSGVLDGDSVSVVEGTAAFSDKNAALNKTVTFTGYTLTGADAGNYILSDQPVSKASITPKTVGLSWTNTAFTYDGGTHLPVATATGIIEGDACTVTVTGGQKDAGSYTATATGLSNKNYALPATATKAFIIAPKTATLTWSDTALTYNGKTQMPSASVSDLVSGDACTVTVSGGQKDAGSYTATATALSNKNYALPATATKAFTIAPKTATLRWSNTSLTYNGKLQKPKVTVTGIIAGDKCTASLTGSRKSAGSYTARVTKLSNKNYALPKVRTRTCTIKKKTVGLKWTQTKLKYNGKSRKPTATATGLIKGDKCTVTVSGAKVKKGTYTAKATKLSNQNYQLPTKRTVRFKIY